MSAITTADGRTLRIHDAGDPTGVPVLVHYGTPSDGRHFAPHTEAARRDGIRLISYDRPGYGGSTTHFGRTVADAASDVATIADALELERLAVWGISGGGPHALACAALLEDRVAAVASLASVAPADADGLDWGAGMGEENLREFEAAHSGAEALEAYLDSVVPQLLAADAQSLADALRSLLTPVDAAVLSGALAEHLMASMQGALGNQIDGWRDDDLAFSAPWGFSLAEITVPVLVWHGEQDLFVPISHGAWLAGRIPTVEARLSADEGHLTLFARCIPEVHRWLLHRL